MLILQSGRCEAEARKGFHAEVLAGLRDNQAAPGVPSGIHRQRLLELARMLSRVQALGDEYARVDFSPRLREQLERIAE